VTIACGHAKRFGVALSMTTPTLAADMAVKAPPVPPPPPIYNWAGFYIGANGGWGESRNCWNFVPAVGAIVADGCSTR
jgi:outer membrane immunogenic protein